MKIKVLLVALLASLSMTSMAQFTSSSASHSATDVKSSYNRLYASYAPMTMSSDGDDSETVDGFAVGWLGGWNVANGTPLYLESGINAQMNFRTEDSYDGNTKYTFVGVNIPLNITYRYSFPNSNVSIAPYAGLHLKANIIGKQTRTSKYYRDESISYFDKDDVADTANRIQVGWQAGVGFNFSNFYIGVGYSAQFTEYMKKTTTGGLVASLGIEF